MKKEYTICTHFLEAEEAAVAKEVGLEVVKGVWEEKVGSVAREAVDSALEVVEED